MYYYSYNQSWPKLNKIRSWNKSKFRIVDVNVELFTHAYKHTNNEFFPLFEVKMTVVIIGDHEMVHTFSFIVRNNKQTKKSIILPILSTTKIERQWWIRPLLSRLFFVSNFKLLNVLFVLGFTVKSCHVICSCTCILSEWMNIPERKIKTLFKHLMLMSSF